MPITSHPGLELQRDAQDSAPWWKAIEFGEGVAWRMMGQFAPQLVPIAQKGPAGILDWLKDHAVEAAHVVFDSMMTPVRSIAGTGTLLSSQFTPIVASLQDAATKIASNDCSPITQAAEKIQQTAERIITPVIEKLQPVVAKVEAFLAGIWDKIGAPIWEWIKQYASQQWEGLKQLASLIWSVSEPMRALGQDAWNWLKNKIGIGDGPEGENGILQWLEAKLDTAWNTIKAQLEPFIKQLAVVRGVISQVVQTVTGPVGKIKEVFSQLGAGISWVRTNLGKGTAIVQARAYVEKQLIPPLANGLHQAGTLVTGFAGGISGALGRFANTLDTAGAAVSGSVLSFAASAVQWIAAEVNGLAAWANQKLMSVATWVEAGVGRLQQFLHGLGEFLQKVESVVSNVWKLPAFLAEKVWNWIPACIRDPIVDFLVPIILRQIEIFQDLARDDQAWQKTKTQVMNIVRKVFVDHDLMGAVKATFNLILRVFNIPPEMLETVASKAAAAWDIVVKKPLDFIKNTVRSLGQGFKLLWTNITTHLEHWIEGWLFGELKEKNIRPPASWLEPKEVFGFVMDVLGISMAHVSELLKQRIDPKLVDKAQAWIGRFRRAWDWVTDVINTSKSPAENTQGLIAKATDFGKSVLTGAVEWIVGKVATELAELSAAAAASGGLSEVLDVARRIYRAMLTAKRWAGRILHMANDALDHVLDIANGNIAKVGGEFEKIMDKGMPAIIGFLGDQVGLGGIGEALRNIVDRLREKVDAAILWLIDKVKGGIEALIGLASSAAGAVRNWWEMREDFNTGDGRPHSLHFAGKPGGDLIVESDPMPVGSFLQQVEPLIDASSNADALRRSHVTASGLLVQLRNRQATLANEDETASADVRRLMSQLAHALDPLLVLRYGPSTTGCQLVGSAPGLGRIGSHGSKPSSLRRQQRPIHELESEHIIPFATGKRLWDMVELAVPRRGRRADKRQTTIMIYEGAARIKTPEDNELSELFETALARADVKRRLSAHRNWTRAGGGGASQGEGSAIVELMILGLKAAKQNAVERTNQAILEENLSYTEGCPLTNGQRRAPLGAPPGTSEPPSPDPNKVAHAAEQQFDDIVGLVQSDIDVIEADQDSG